MPLKEKRESLRDVQELVPSINRWQPSRLGAWLQCKVRILVMILVKKPVRSYEIRYTYQVRLENLIEYKVLLWYQVRATSPHRVTS